MDHLVHFPCTAPLTPETRAVVLSAARLCLTGLHRVLSVDLTASSKSAIHISRLDGFVWLLLLLGHEIPPISGDSEGNMALGDVFVLLDHVAPLLKEKT